MATNEYTLLTLLFGGSPSKCAEVLMTGFERSYSGAWGTLVTLQRRQIEAAVEHQVESGFKVSLGSILATGWNDVAKVREAIDQSAKSAGDSRTVTLLSHEFEWSSKPKLVISIDGVNPFEVEFDLVLSLGIDSAILTISDGKIRTARMGDFRSEVKLMCKDALIYHWPLKSGRLPGEITVDDGIPQRSSGYDELLFGRRPRGVGTGL
jgi:hypothetical protein